MGQPKIPFYEQTFSTSAESVKAILFRNSELILFRASFKAWASPPNIIWRVLWSLRNIESTCVWTKPLHFTVLKMHCKSVVCTLVLVQLQYIPFYWKVPHSKVNTIPIELSENQTTWHWKYSHYLSKINMIISTKNAPEPYIEALTLKNSLYLNIDI